MAKSSAALQKENSSPMRFPLKRFLGIFLLLTIGSILAIFVSAGGGEFLVKALRQLWARPSILALIVGLLLLEWYTDYLRYYSLAKGLDIDLPLGFGLKIVFANLFFAYLTPGGAFGAPVIIYMMVKRGEKLSHAVALALIKPFLLFFVLLLGGSMLFWFNDFTLTAATQNVLWVSSVFMGFLTLAVASSIFFPDKGRKVTDSLFQRLRTWRNKRGHAETPRLDKWQQGFQSTIEAFSLFGAKKLKYLLYSLLATIANLVLFLGISVVLLQALGFSISMQTSWVMSFLYYFVVAFAPTPGGSGIAEGGGYLFFKQLGSKELVGSYVILWRFLSSYLVLIIGGFLFFRFVQQLRVNELKDMQQTRPVSPAGEEPYAEDAP